jgi:hypothetical protein
MKRSDKNMYIVYRIGEPVQTCRNSQEAYDIAMKFIINYFGIVSEEVEQLTKSYENNSRDFGVMGYVWIQKLKAGDLI